jgi:uncharacterized protein (DUF924 family)
MSRADEVLAYWFGEGEEFQKFWFGQSDETDKHIKSEFGADVEKALKGEHDEWAHTARGRLALIILLDQMTRNIFRGTPRAFAGDPKALALAKEGLDRGMDKGLGIFERLFFRMPLMHSEVLADQDACVRTMKALESECAAEHKKAVESSSDYAVRHRDIVARFGRFPHRNKIVGRESTAEETEFLKQPGSGF